MKFEWKCPRCSASAHKHGKGGADCCINGQDEQCEGLICDCDPEQCPDSELEAHGTTLDNRCTEANCYHCGWGGTVPKAPKGLQGWEKKALEAGWTPPAHRHQELVEAP
jgi:hypothetical protein